MTEEDTSNKRTYLRIYHDRKYELIDLTDEEANVLLEDITFNPRMGTLLRITGVIPHEDIMRVKDALPDVDVPCFRESISSEET
jgi:hypothetical protein